MCGRFVQAFTFDDLLGLCDALELDIAELAPDYNVSPGRGIVAVMPGERHRVTVVHWGIPYANGRGLNINARAESADRKPMFCDAFRRGRCLIPASGFYEWEQRGATGQPWFFARKDGGICWFAALFIDAPGGHRCTILTTVANEEVAKIHDRMPVILKPEAAVQWLDPGWQDYAALKERLQPWPGEGLLMHPVAKRVNSRAENGPECVEPVELKAVPHQPELF
jgi:putative SOS response-associated peptidase YedK